MVLIILCPLVIFVLTCLSPFFRSTFSPIFSSVKLKGMMDFFHKSNVKLEHELSKCATNGEMIELNHYFRKYTMDIIGSCVFGVDSGAFETKESDFVKYNKQFFTMTPLSLMRMFLIVPNLNDMFKKFLFQIGLRKIVSLPNEPANRFFVQIIQSIIQTRKETKVKNNDLIDLMINAIKEQDNDAEGDVTRKNNTKADENEHSKEQFEMDAKLNGFAKEIAMSK